MVVFERRAPRRALAEASDDGGGRAARIIVIEDDDIVREAMARSLEQLGHDVEALADGAGLLADLARRPADLILLDIGLPGPHDGFDLAARVRADHGTPVIFVTARGDLDDRMRGFDLGADDYVVKPFSLVELGARVRVVLRRSAVTESVVRSVRDVVLDPAARTVTRAGNRVHLTPTEFDVLAALMATPGESRTKQELLAEVWGFDDHAPHLVEVQVSSLRRKLEEFGDRIVITCRGGAYMVVG